MAERMSEIAVAKVKLAIGALVLPQMVKDRIEWEVVTAVLPQGVLFVPVVRVKIPGTVDDYELIMPNPADAMDCQEPQADWDSVVTRLVTMALQQADQRGLGIKTQQNGSGKTSPGGLHLPG